MENIFAKRRARLLAMKAMRENYVPGEKLVTCPHCGGESQRRDVAAALSVCPLCGYHFPMGAYYRLSSVLDPGSFRELHEKLRGGRAGQPLSHGQHERRRRGKADAGHRVRRKKQAAPDPLCRQRRGADAGGHFIPHADGENQRGSGPVFGKGTAVHLRSHGPHHRRRHRQLCLVRRHYSGRTRCAYRLWPTGC